MTLKNKVITQVIELRGVGKRMFAKLSLDSKAKEFWLSPKQAAKLTSCLDKVGPYASKNGEIHAVIDGDRFVWCGVHSHTYSELQFLEERFCVKTEPLYVKTITPIFNKELLE